MQIARFQKIKNHRIFRDFTWPANGLPDFARFNLIYGWNGAGKTTLSNLFRYLQDKSAIGEGEVQLVVDGRSVRQGDIPTAALPPVRVFNRDTVDRTIFEVPGRELPPVYFLGEDSVEKQKQVEALKQDANQLELEIGAWEQKQKALERELESFCTERGRAIKNLLTSAGGGPYNNYNTANFKKTADRLLNNGTIAKLTPQQRKRHLSTKEGMAKDKISQPIAHYPDFIALTQKVQAILGRSVVANTIEQLVQNPVVANWVGQGLALHRSAPASAYCKFCNQPLPAQRLQQLEAHFNDEFKSFQQAVTGLLGEVEAAQSFINAIPVPNKGLLYPHLVASFEEAETKLKLQSELVCVYLAALQRALVQKKDEPFQALDFFRFLTGDGNPEESSSKLETFFQGLITVGAGIGQLVGSDALQKIGELVAEHNRLSDNFANEVAAARKALEEDDIAEALDAYRTKLVASSSALSELGRVRGELAELKAKIAKLEIAIRNHQPAALQLNQDMAAYLGRQELVFEAREAGYVITRDGKPALHLSEGERTAIAFMYFLKSLEDTSFDLKNGVVVIDDPVSSLDANSLYCAFGFMKARTQNAGQVFILTHNFTFFRQVKNWFRYCKNAQFYMLSPAMKDGQRTALLSELDPLLRNHESEYQHLFQTVLRASSSPQAGALSEFYGLPNLARRLLEAVLSFKRPDKAGELHQKLESVQGFDVAKKARIIRFTHTYSHHEMVVEPEHDLSILAESPAILRDILALIQHLDDEHYQCMLSICKEEPEEAADIPAVEERSHA